MSMWLSINTMMLITALAPIIIGFKGVKDRPKFPLICFTFASTLLVLYVISELTRRVLT